MSKSRIRITNLSDEDVKVGWKPTASGSIIFRSIPPKEIKEFNLEDVKRDRVLDLESRGYISTHLIPAIAELPEEAEVSRFELMEI